jgi:mRNA interferase MazF
MAFTDVPRRREVWLVALGAGRAGEPGKTRPAIVVSDDELSIGAPGDLIVVVRLSSSLAPSALRVDVAPIAGIDRPSRAICKAVRAVVSSRFVLRIGAVDQATMNQVETALALILGLDRRPSLA